MKIAIVGAGKLGMKVTNALAGGNHSITIIDKNEAIINRISHQYDVLTVVGDAKQVSLLRPARRDAAGVVDNAVTGEMTVVFCVREHARHQTRILRPPDHARKLSVGRDRAGGDLLDDRKHLPRKVIIQSGSAHIRSPFIGMHFFIIV